MGKTCKQGDKKLEPRTQSPGLSQNLRHFLFVEGKVMCMCVFRHAWSFSCVWLFATPWIVTSQAPLSRGFCRQEYGNGLSFPSSRHFPNRMIETESPVSTALQVDSFTPLSHYRSLNNGHIRQCILGWPQSSFEFFCVTKIQRNFLASSVQKSFIGHFSTLI